MINLFFYLGVLQYFTIKLSWVINFLMGTSATESINAVANIFLGQVYIFDVYLDSYIFFPFILCFLF